MRPPATSLADRFATMRLLLVDDHPVFLEGLAEALTRQADFEIVGMATDSDAAIDACQRLAPDLVLLDLA
ncbi:MAG: DNA-binding response regulator, partial [Planctomycetia bacterium]|nr:DNA-binding response regulator [Planctomycetia bacterium]